MTADRAAILRPRIAPRAHRPGKDRVSRRPALAGRGGDGIENLDRSLQARGRGHGVPKPLPFRGGVGVGAVGTTLCRRPRSEEHTSELQSLMRNSYAVFCLKKKKNKTTTTPKRTKRHRH